MDMSITKIEDNTSFSNTIFLACLFTGKNCEFIKCEFIHDCVIKESCKFTNCRFGEYCNFARGSFARGCEFVKCKFDGILMSKIIY